MAISPTLLLPTKGSKSCNAIQEKPATYKSFASVEPEIVAALKRQQFKTLFTDDMSRFMNRSTAADLLRTFALEKNATSKTIELQENDNSPILEKLFELRVGDWAFFVDAHKGYAIKPGPDRKNT